MYSILIFIFVTILSYILYLSPELIGITKIHSSADDALISTGKYLLNFKNPYLYQLPGGAPISPGGGWVLINCIFINKYIYPLLNPTYLFILFWVLKSKYSLNIANKITILTISNLIFLSFLSSGHDLFAAGCVVTAIIVLSKKIIEKNNILIYFLISLFLTSRSLFIIIPFIIFSNEFKNNKTKSITFLASTSFFSFLIHYSFYLIDKTYPPMHLINKAILAFGDYFFIIIIFSCVSFLITFFINLKFKINLLLYSSVVLISIFTVVSFSELALYNFQIPLWEGANYLGFLSSLGATNYLINNKKD